jgi:hypothetical protein
MKTTFLVALVGVSLTLLCALPIALARADASSEGLGVWEGSGNASDAGGTQQMPFTVTMVRRLLSNGVVRSDGTLHMSDGRDITFWDEHESRAGGACRMTSSMGAGGGRCFPNHMCQTYTERADGHAFATTVAADSTERVRVLVTELQEGKAVRFYAQELTKKP